MKKTLLQVFIFIMSINSYSQISYKKGYIINNHNIKTECLIKDNDPKNTPLVFNYRLNENTPILKGDIKLIKEFGIPSKYKYQRFTVNIDESSEDIDDLSYERAPQFAKKTLFLKVLIEGKGNLYLHSSNLKLRLFYKKETSNIEQLIFKSFFLNQNQISQNDKFKQQLWGNFKCSDTNISEVKNMEYNQYSISEFIIKYNECNSENNNSSKDYTRTKEKKGKFNLTPRLGFTASNFSLEPVGNTIESNKKSLLSNEYSLRFGLEAEIIFGFNKNKWSAFIEPNYHEVSSKKVSYKSTEYLATFKIFKIPFGVRHYMFLNEKSKLFINGAIVPSFNSGSLLNFNSGTKLDFRFGFHTVLGIGYNFNNKLSVEFRHNFNDDIIEAYIYSSFNTSSLIIGYTLF